MKKKIVYILVLFISLFMFSNKVEAKETSKSICCYSNNLNSTLLNDNYVVLKNVSNNDSLTNDSTSESTKKNGCDILGYGKVYKFVKWAITLIRYLIPILIAVFGLTEYLGVVFSGEEKNMKEAQRRVIIRVVIGIIALVIPSLLKLIINISGLFTGMDSNDIFCGLI